MAKPKILVFQHVPYEPLGSLDPLLKSFGFRIRYVNFGREPDMTPDLTAYDGLVVLGGPMNADQIDAHPNLSHEVDLIADALDREKPVLGICLGAQLLAKAIGGSVVRNQQREIGWFDVELTEHGRADAVLGEFDTVQRVFQWHEDGIRLPPDIPHLATSERSDVQAFAVGEHSYGFQFHLEVDQPLVERWLRVPENQSVLTDTREPVDRERLRLETEARIDDLKDLSTRTFSRWIRRFELPARKLILPSR